MFNYFISLIGSSIYFGPLVGDCFTQITQSDYKFVNVRLQRETRIINGHKIKLPSAFLSCKKNRSMFPSQPA